MDGLTLSSDRERKARLVVAHASGPAAESGRQAWREVDELRKLVDRLVSAGHQSKPKDGGDG